MKVIHGGHTTAASVPWTEHFTGTAWMDLLLKEPLTSTQGDVLVTTVSFSPGVRTHWHRHEGGQLLLVTAGQGWIGDRAGGTEIVHTGDVIWTPGGEDHWHGATQSTAMTHIAITLGATQWYDEVVDVLTTPS
jgi:quercetin dioxygenase-like cupin family protein